MKIFCSSENNVKIFYRLTAGAFPGSLPKPRQSVLQIGLSAVFSLILELKLKPSFFVFDNGRTAVKSSERLRM